jgi:hypothetical protein
MPDPTTSNPLRRVFRSWPIASLAVVCGCIAGPGCHAGPDGGSSGMFSWFGKKDAEGTTSRVAPELNARLEKLAAPRGTLIAVGGSTPNAGCKRIGVAGAPPEASVVARDRTREQEPGFHVPAQAGQGALLIANFHGARERFDIWDASDADPPRFVRQRSLQLDPAAGGWIGFTAQDLVCLPGGRLAIAVSYNDPRSRYAVYSYDRATGASKRIGEAAPDRAREAHFLDVLELGKDAVLLLHSSGVTRAAAEYYYNAYSHLRLHSAAHPDGIGLLDLAAVDGTVIAWGLDGTRLILQTRDERGAGPEIERYWSLDLAAVLR